MQNKECGNKKHILCDAYMFKKIKFENLKKTCFFANKIHYYYASLKEFSRVVFSKKRKVFWPIFRKIIKNTKGKIGRREGTLQHDETIKCVRNRVNNHFSFYDSSIKC